MAKKKKRAQEQPKKVSVEKYMIERARKLPLGKCYVNPDWKEHGMAQVVVTRQRKNGYLVMCVFLVDTYCLGVKDIICQIEITPERLEEVRLGVRATKEISYAEAHNLILGAVEFAEEAGLEPCKEYSYAQYILDEDTDEIPLISYEYGRDGKHLLMLGPSGKDRLLIPTLQKKLGDNFDYILPVESMYDDYSFDSDDEFDVEFADGEYFDDDEDDHSFDEEYSQPE